VCPFCSSIVFPIDNLQTLFGGNWLKEPHLKKKKREAAEKKRVNTAPRLTTVHDLKS
jgi:hypothetical protein